MLKRAVAWFISRAAASFFVIYLLEIRIKNAVASGREGEVHKYMPAISINECELCLAYLLLFMLY